MPRPGLARFVMTNAIVWVLMTAILVVVPDNLERWIPLQIGRVLGWAVACSVWVVAVEQQWKERVSGFSRFVIQLVLWVSAALLAMFISDTFRVRVR